MKYQVVTEQEYANTENKPHSASNGNDESGIAGTEISIQEKCHHAVVSRQLWWLARW